VLLPRFSIHSWNDDGSANEPWMYAAAVPTVRALLGLRHRLTPYLKECLRRYSDDYAPTVRPLFLTFPDDPACWVEQDVFMLGEQLLAAPAVDEGAETVDVVLPRGADWEDYWTGGRHAGGETVRLACPLDRPPMLLRAGAALPLNLAPAHFNSAAFERGVRIAAPVAGKIGGGWIEDDGTSINGPSAPWRIEGEATEWGITLSVSVSGMLATDRRLTLVLSSSERRPVALSGGHVERERDVAGERLIDIVAL